MAQAVWVFHGSDGKEYRVKHEVAEGGDEYWYVSNTVTIYVTPATEPNLYDVKVYPCGWFRAALTDEEVLNFVSTWARFFLQEKEE